MDVCVTIVPIRVLTFAILRHSSTHLYRTHLPPPIKKIPQKVALFLVGECFLKDTVSFTNATDAVPSTPSQRHISFFYLATRFQCPSQLRRPPPPPAHRCAAWRERHAAEGQGPRELQLRQRRAWDVACHSLSRSASSLLLLVALPFASIVRPLVLKRSWRRGEAPH